jgi:hypothetical protein
MKKCSKCLIEKPLTEYYSRSSRCRQCHNEYTRQHYRDNRDRYLSKAKKATEETRQFIRKLKTTTPCHDCGVFYHFSQMDFDHLSDKKACISDLLDRGMAILKEEIGKCEIVCANCHRLRTFYRGQHNMDGQDGS